MSDQCNNSELFVELSTEEQQLIAGGQFMMIYPMTGMGFGTSFTRYSRTQSGIGFGLGGFNGFGGLSTGFGTQYSINSGSGFFF